MNAKAIRLAAAALIATLPTGCARWYEDRDDKADRDPLYAWLDEKDETLVMRWGAPDAAYELKEGGRVLTWRRERIERQGGEIFTVNESRIVNGKTVLAPVTQQKPFVNVRLHCTTSMKLDADGYVVGYDRDGNDCNYYLPPPD